ncbi:MAG: 2-phospho-L-lactate transferase CofD family protein, partial [Halobacteriaceae archaeon]
MITFLSGGTGTPKLLAGAVHRFDPGEITVVANTGDDVELGGLLVCPDIDTVLFERAGILDKGTWWGIADDTDAGHALIASISRGLDLEGTRRLPGQRQTMGREIAHHRRFSIPPEFMYLGDRDRAIHHVRTSLLDEGKTLTRAIDILGEALDVEVSIRPMSNDPVATYIHGNGERPLHFQEFWVARDGEPAVESVEFRGVDAASPTPEMLEALERPVVIGPSNPVTSIG